MSGHAWFACPCGTQYLCPSDNPQRYCFTIRNDRLCGRRVHRIFGASVGVVTSPVSAVGEHRG